MRPDSVTAHSTPRCSQTAWMPPSSDADLVVFFQGSATSLHIKGAERGGFCWSRFCTKQHVARLPLHQLESAENATTPSLASFEDGALIELALAGQTGSFDILMARHLGAVRKRIVSIVPNTTDADDLLQEVAFKVRRRLSTFRAESSFRTWMTRIAVNEALQFYRRGPLRRLCQPLEDFDNLVSGYESPHQSLARGEVVQAVRSEVGKLPEKYKQVVMLQSQGFEIFCNPSIVSGLSPIRRLRGGPFSWSRLLCCKSRAETRRNPPGLRPQTGTEVPVFTPQIIDSSQENRYSCTGFCF